MTTRKSLRIESITTCEDGEIILEGEGLAISIKRVNGQYSSAHKVNVLFGEDQDHTTTILDIFKAPGGLAF